MGTKTRRALSVESDFARECNVIYCTILLIVVGIFWTILRRHGCSLADFHCISSLDPQCLTEPKKACPAAAVVDYILGMIAIVMFRRRDQCC